VGINVLYSGTVSAATEAAILGVPSLAISLDTREDADYTAAARFARKMAAFILENPLSNVALNVNVPAVPEEEIRGVVVTKQGRARLMESFEKRTDPRNNIYYWLAGETQLPEQEQDDTDASALKRGMITITPIHFDLTRHDLLEDLRARVKKTSDLW
jgi:5'-nucleotidase